LRHKQFNRGNESYKNGQSIMEWRELAQSDSYEIIENNVYFPLDSINKEYFVPSSTTSHCP